MERLLEVNLSLLHYYDFMMFEKPEKFRQYEELYNCLEDELEKDFGWLTDNKIEKKTRQFQEIVSEAVGLRDLWHSFDSSIQMLNPEIVHPVAAEMLLSSPKWFVHMVKPGMML